MALFSRVTTWVTNQVLTAAALNGEFNNILNNAQVSSMIGFSANVSQMQQQTSPGGVGTESLSGSGSDELQRIRFMLAYIMGTTYWYDQTGGNLSAGGVGTNAIANLAVTTAKIALQAVGTAQLANAAVTGAKLAASNIVTTASTGSFSTTNTTAPTGSVLSGLVATTPSLLTTSSRPVSVKFYPDTSGNASAIYSSYTNFYLYRSTGGATPVRIQTLQMNATSGSATIIMPPGTVEFLDMATAANTSYTYSVCVTTNGNACQVFYCVLTAKETV